MKKCKIYHTGTYDVVEAVIVDNHVLIPLKEKDDPKGFKPQKVVDGVPLFSPSDYTWWAETECNKGFVQFEVDGKWGFFKNSTGRILIEPTWDFAGPFYSGVAMVSIGCDLSRYREANDYVIIEYIGGKYGFINYKGNVKVPIIYDNATEVNSNHRVFVMKYGKWEEIDLNDRKRIYWDLVMWSGSGYK